MPRTTTKKPALELVKCPRCNGLGELCIGCSCIGADPMDDAKGLSFGSCGTIETCSVCDGRKTVPKGTACLDVRTRKMVVA